MGRTVTHSWPPWALCKPCVPQGSPGQNLQLSVARHSCTELLCQEVPPLWLVVNSSDLAATTLPTLSSQPSLMGTGRTRAQKVHTCAHAHMHTHRFSHRERLFEAGNGSQGRRGPEPHGRANLRLEEAGGEVELEQAHAGPAVLL